MHYLCIDYVKCNLLFYFNRDTLIQQLEKSQEMLMNFQQELNAAEMALQLQREENKRYISYMFYILEYSVKCLELPMCVYLLILPQRNYI